MKPHYFTLLLTAALAAISSRTLEAQNLNLLWSRVEYSDNLGGVNLICQDIDGDGKAETIFTGGSQDQHFFVTRIENGELKTKWSSRWFTQSYLSVLLTANLDQDADTEIYAVFLDGTVEVYDGATLQIIDQFQSDLGGARAGAIADVDQDGHAELVLTSDNLTGAYDLVTRQTDWLRPNLSGTTLATGDVDGDGAVEIVVSINSWTGNTGYVLNGATGNTEWQYLGGFGSKIGLADVNNDNVPEIIGLGIGVVTYFDGAAHSPVAQFYPQSSDLSALLVTDIEQDGQAEIITGDGQWGKIRCYDAETQDLIWEISNPNHGVTNLAVGDADGDGLPEVIWGAGASSSGSDQLYFYNIDSQQSVLVSRDLDGPFILDAAKHPTDETIDFFVSSSGSNSNYDPGHLLQFNSGQFNLDWDFTTPAFNKIRKMRLAHSRSNAQPEIVVGSNYGITILDADSHEILFESASGGIREIKNADLDADGRDEIIIGNESSNTITILKYNNGAYQNWWTSINFGSYVTSLDVANIDNDPAPELVFSLYNGVIEAIDSKTKLLQWQILAIAGDESRLAVADLDNDGVQEIVFAANNQIFLYSTQTQQQTAVYFIPGGSNIQAIAVANLDSSARKEILLYDDRLKVIDTENFTSTWESDMLGNGYGDDVSIIVKDLYEDQHVDILLGTYFGAFLFSSESKTPDVIPPRVVAYQPANNATFQGINAAPVIRFSERLDTALIQANNVYLSDKSGNLLPCALLFDTLTQTLVCQPLNPLPISDTITVFLSAALADLSQNTLDGDNNGVGSGTATDDFSWKFSTGTDIDAIGPKVLVVALAPTEVWPGITVKMTTALSDNSTVAQSGVVAAEYFIGQTGANGTGTPVDAADGHWGGNAEAGTATIITDDLTAGTYTVYVHARDQQGNWGDWKERNFTVLKDSEINWPMFGQNTQHTNYSQNCALEPPLKIKWAKNYSNRILKPVTYANGNLLAPMQHHTSESKSVLYCLDTLDGSSKWSYSFGSIFSINPAAYGYGRVFVQTCNNTPGTLLSSFSLTDGSLLWQTPFEAQWERYLGPTIADGKLFMNGGMYGGIYSFDALSGQKRWFKTLPQFDEWTPAYYQNRVYTFAGGILTVFKGTNGQELWTKELAFDFTSYDMKTAPVIDTLNKIVFTTSNTYLHAISIDSHDIIWSLTGGLSITPALKNGVLYVVNNGKLEARNAATGAILWSFAGDNQLSYPPALTNDYLYVSSADHLYAVDLSTGTQKWSYPAGGAITLAENLLVLTNPDNVLRVFEHGMTSAVQEQAAVDFHLQVTPNPVIDHTQINFSLPRAAHAEITISDLAGKRVAALGNENYQAGEHFIIWNPQGLAAGVYRCSITMAGFSSSRKIVVMR